MNKPQLIEVLAARLGITYTESERYLNAFVALVYETLALDPSAKINISGFGQFSVSHRAPRLGVNPRTMEKITIPELRTPKFKAGETFKVAIALKQ